MSAEARVEAARLALAHARQALRNAEAAIDALEAEVKTLRAAYKSSRGRVDCTCQNPACGKAFTVPASDIRAGNRSGRFCCFACSVAAGRVGRPRKDGSTNDGKAVTAP